jgi:hypothetical protein
MYGRNEKFIRNFSQKTLRMEKMEIIWEIKAKKGGHY